MPSPPAAAPSARRAAGLFAAAALLHGAFDYACTAVGAAPPYLRLSDAPEVFQLLSPVAVTVATSCVSGVIALIALAVVGPGRAHRALAVGATITGFWIFSAGLSRAAWFSTPLGPTAAAIACGIPRGLVIGWVLVRLSAARTETTGAAE